MSVIILSQCGALFDYAMKSVLNLWWFVHAIFVLNNRLVEAAINFIIKICATIQNLSAAVRDGILSVGQYIGDCVVAFVTSTIYAANLVAATTVRFINTTILTLGRSLGILPPPLPVSIPQAEEDFYCVNTNTEIVVDDGFKFANYFPYITDVIQELTTSLSSIFTQIYQEISYRFISVYDAFAFTILNIVTSGYDIITDTAEMLYGVLQFPIIIAMAIVDFISWFLQSAMTTIAVPFQMIRQFSDNVASSGTDYMKSISLLIDSFVSGISRLGSAIVLSPYYMVSSFAAFICYLFELLRGCLTMLLDIIVTSTSDLKTVFYNYISDRIATFVSYTSEIGIVPLIMCSVGVLVGFFILRYPDACINLLVPRLISDILWPSQRGIRTGAVGNNLDNEDSDDDEDNESNDDEDVDNIWVNRLRTRTMHVNGVRHPSIQPHVNDPAPSTSSLPQGRATPPLGARLAAERERLLCIICQDRNKTVLLLPCRHLCMCAECVQEYQRQAGARPPCPLCRVPVQSILNVFT